MRSSFPASIGVAVVTRLERGGDTALAVAMCRSAPAEEVAMRAAAVSGMTLVFCPFAHMGTSGSRLHCSYMFVELGDGTQEVWRDPPPDVYDNVYSGVIAERIIHPCPRDVEHVSEPSS
jgi:hypothetical protein